MTSNLHQDRGGTALTDGAFARIGSGGDAATPPEPDVVLNPGDFHFGGPVGRISTLLGSCVALTFWHPLLHLGGMCHYVLPSRQDRFGDDQPPDGRYADEAMELFLREIRAVGTRPGEYQVRLYGGGQQFAPTGPGGFDVPQRNLEAALHLLDHYGLRVQARHIGGRGARHVTLDLATGDVQVRVPAGEGET